MVKYRIAEEPPRRGRPSALAQKLSDAFAPCGDWSEVRIVRDEFGRRERRVSEPRRAQPGPVAAPYDWAEAA